MTDAATGSPVAGAKVTAGDGSADTDAQGRYSLLLVPGDHTVAVSAFGYQDGSAQVSLAAGQTLSQDLALTAVPMVHLTGALHDGSGHGWPLYATITVPGDPGGPFHTDPYTGAYDLVLPADSTQQLTFAPALPGYQKVTRSVTVGTATAGLDVTAPVDAAACTAPGYAAVYDGLTEPFAAATAPAGWTVDDLAGNGAVWAFGNPGGIGNRTTGSGGFAAVNGRTFPTGTLPDTELTSPATDLSDATTPQLEFHTYLLGYYNPGSHAQADLSTDDGRTWQTVWDKQSAGVSGALQTVALPQAAGKSQVKVRFHFQGSSANDWQVDDVSLGRRSCAPQSGGLLAGRVTDANTKAGLNGVTVGSTEAGGPSARTASTGDPAVGDGFYTLFSAAGTHTFSAGAAHRTTVQKSPKVAADAVTKVNFPLPAGQVVVSGGVTGTVKMGTSKTATVTLHNTGGAPATVKLNQAGGGYSLLTSPSGKPAGVAATTSRHSLVGSRTAAAAVTRPALAGSAADPAWTYGPDYPTGIADNVVSSYDGKVYSVGGLSADGNNVMSLTSAGYVLDPGTGGWKPIAPEPVVRDQGDGAFVGGKLYVTGGWSAAQDGSTVTALDIYDPHTDTWSTGAPVPTAYAASGVTALDGRLYLVGGCRQRCGSTDVWVYTPGTDRWQKAASYPEATSWVSCGTIAGRIYCAGGTTDNQSSINGYSYDPATNAWKPIAAMPMDIWGAAYSAANGLLIVAGGASGNGTWIDQESYAYDAATDTWSALPAWNVQPSYRGGGACGFYTVGGGDEGPDRLTRILAGFDACDGTSVSWLTLDNRTLTLQPGQSATVTATLDAAAPSVTQPGDFTAEVDLGTDTPYRLAPLPVTMHVTPPSSWGKLTGTVTGVDCDGKPAPLAGASVQISSWVATYSLVTGTDGSFSLWLDKRNNPLTMTAYAPDHLAVTRTVKIVAGITTTEDFSLASSICL
ncbi:galactose oxidase [Streptomyces cocklensis]|nr:galactose oxidase [Actinacidiphila cocklensis]